MADLNKLGDEVFTTANEHQHIDLQKLFDYWHDPKIQEVGDIRSMHLELLDLVKECGFLEQVEKARKELEVPQPEDILPKEY